MTGIEVGLAVASIAGAGASAYGQIKGAQAQSDAAQKSAALKSQQADELLSREAINEGIMSREFGRAQSGYQSDFGSTGREGAGIGGALRMQQDFDITLSNAKRDADFKAYMLRQGADIDATLASDYAASGYWGAAGTVLGAGAEAYSLYRKGPTGQLPPVGG